ncbi:MAG: hypothetical protein ACK5T2_12815 [bacterium]|jgi:hypothetical protein
METKYSLRPGLDLRAAAAGEFGGSAHSSAAWDPVSSQTARKALIFACHKPDDKSESGLRHY